MVEVAPVSTKKFLDLPAAYSCTLGSSSMMAVCDRTAGWTGPAYIFLNVREGVALDLEALWSQGESASQCPH